MRTLRLALSAGIYLTLILVYILAVLWVWEGYNLLPVGKVGVLFMGALIAVPAVLMLEIPKDGGDEQGFRDDLLDALLDEGTDDENA